MSGAMCAYNNCPNKAEWYVTNEATEDLHETWAACNQHTASIARFLVSRSNGWGYPSRKVEVKEISRARA